MDLAKLTTDELIDLASDVARRRTYHPDSGVTLWGKAMRYADIPRAGGGVTRGSGASVRDALLHALRLVDAENGHGDEDNAECDADYEAGRAERRVA